MTRKTTLSPSAARRALVIIGHGSTQVVGASATTEAHAEAVRNLDLFAEVRTAYVNGLPDVGACLDGLDVDHVTIIPNFACDGYLSRSVIPNTLRLTGKVSERIGPNGRQTVSITDAIGSHPMLASIAATRVQSIINQHDLNTADTAIVVIGHGTTRARASFEATAKLADALLRQGLCGEARPAFLDEQPKLQDWATITTSPNVIALPFLMSLGTHGRRDVPKRIGLDPDNPEIAQALESGQDAHGPTMISGRKLWLIPPIGMDPAITDVILERAAVSKASTLARCAPQGIE